MQRVSQSQEPKKTSASEAGVVEAGKGKERLDRGGSGHTYRCAPQRQGRLLGYRDLIREGLEQRQEWCDLISILRSPWQPHTE